VLWVLNVKRKRVNRSENVLAVKGVSTLKNSTTLPDRFVGDVRVKKGKNMGYESRIYIVRRNRQYDPDIDKTWAEVLAVFNLGRVTVDYENLVREHPATDLFVYADDGNTRVVEDCCGEPLKEFGLLDMRDILYEEMDRRGVHGYSDSMWTLAKGVLPLLIQKHGFSNGKIVCLHYGY
jgi:hypothetical protein